MSAPLAPRATRPSDHRRLYIAVTLALPLLLVGVLELGLRLGGYGSSYPLFVAYPPRPEYLYPNPEVGKRYFRARSFSPTPEVEFFRARKEPGTFRIAFQGESSAQGYPYGHGGSPARMLEQRLQATFPDRDIEVVNTALNAISSYTLLDFAGEILAQRPDAVLIYTGHNEYYGVLGVGSTRPVGGWRPLVKAYLALGRLRTTQLLGNAVAAGAGVLRQQRADAGARSVMELMAGEQRIPLGSRPYQLGLAQFRANLGELLSRYRSAGVPVFIGTVASNERDQAPLISGLAPGTDSAAWWRTFDAAATALARGDSLAAERALVTAVGLDSTGADALFALGKLLDARGDRAAARSYYRAAKEHDQLRFRAPEAINQIIRDEAARHGATVVETQRALERAAPDGIIGRTLMLEHLHPNLDGYFVIADAFYEALRGQKLIGPWRSAIPAEVARLEVPVTPLDSLAGLFRVDRLLSAWPFQPAGAPRTPVVDTLRPGSSLEHLAQAVVLGRLPWAEATERLRADYDRTGDYDGAIRAARALAQEFSFSVEPYVDAARMAVKRRRYDDAIRYIAAANARRETARGVQLLGLLLLRQGDHAAAIPHLERGAALAPRDERMRVTLTAARSIPGLERARVRSPRDPAVLYNLAAAYALTQQYEMSREILARLRRVDPDHAGALELLRRLPQ